MEFVHTERTRGIRSDDELVALYLMIVEHSAIFEKQWTVDDFEYKFRGTPGFERGLKAITKWLVEYKAHVLAEEVKQ